MCCTQPCPSIVPQPRFAIHQEVFILDNNHSEPTSLTTYLVISNHQITNTGQRIYELVPNPGGVYRTIEPRLLEVGYGNGAEVIKGGDVMPAIVVKRYVVQGRRVYDLKDALEVVIKGVPEDELRPHRGGVFSFVART